MQLGTNKFLIFKFFISILAVILIPFSIFNFFKSTTAVTDENIFEDPISRLYINKKVDIFREEKTKDGEFKYFTDSLVIGDLLIGIDSMRVSSLPKYQKKLDELDVDSLVKLHVLNYNKKYIKKVFLKKKNLPNDFITELSSCVRVREVYRGGTSEKSGLKVNDFIIEVNGKSFENATQADKLFRSHNNNSRATYTILRNNKQMQIDIVLKKFGVSFHGLIVFLSGLMCMVLGTFFGFKRPAYSQARVLGLSLIAMGFLFTNIVSADMIFYGSYAYVRALIFDIAFFLGLPIVVQSFFYFPNKYDKLLKKKWILFVPYIVGGLALLFSETLEFYFGWPLKLGVHNFFFVIILVGFYSFVRIKYRKLISVENVRTGRTLKFVLFSVAILFIANYMFNINIIFLYSFFGYNPYTKDFHFIKHFLSFVAFVPFMYFYTVGRYRYFELDIRLKRNIQYIFVAGIWNILLVTTFAYIIWMLSTFDIEIPNLHFDGTTIEILDHPIRENLQIIYSKILLTIQAFILAVIFYKIGKYGTAFIDNKYYRMKFDYRGAAEKIAKVLESNMTLDDLSSLIVQQLRELVSLKQVGVIFFKDEKIVVSQSYYGFNDNEVRDFCVYTGEKLVESISEFENSIRIEYLPTVIKDVFIQCKFQYLIPIRSKGKVVGAMLIGEKRSESAYNAEDIDFLSNISSQAGVSVENIILYQGVAKQERLKHELELARKIQLASLPDTVPDIQHIDISGVSIPALEVGGDFYDFLNGSDKKLTVVVGDVSGKGTSAALYMSKTQGIIRTLNEFKFSPKQLFQKTNNLLYKYIDKNSFITVIGAQFDFDKSILKISRAGHLPLFYYKSKENIVNKLTPKGIVLGITNSQLFDANLDESEIEFEENDIFVFITDGVVEARNPEGEEYEDDRLIQNIYKLSDLSAEEIRDGIVKTVHEFSQTHEQFDDLTVVVIKVNKQSSI